MIRNWTICGPFNAKHRAGSCAQSSARIATRKKNFVFDYIGNEPQAEIKPGDVLGGVTCYAHEESVRPNFIRFDDRSTSKEKVFYMTTYVYSPQATSCYVLVATQGRTKLWVNHTNMFERTDDTKKSLSDSVGVSVLLQQGWNVLMLKIQGHWTTPNDFQVAISDNLNWDAEKTDLIYSVVPVLPEVPPVVVPPVVVPPVVIPVIPEVAPPIPDIPLVIEPPVVDEEVIQQEYKQYTTDLAQAFPATIPATYQEFAAPYRERPTPPSGSLPSWAIYAIAAAVVVVVGVAIVSKT